LRLKSFMKISPLRFLLLFCLTAFISTATVKHIYATSLHTSSDRLCLFSSQLSNVFSASSSGSSIPFSKWNVLLSIEELEENEDGTEKDNLQVLIFADLSHTVHFKNTLNSFFVFQPLNRVFLSIPLHVRNCIYQI
jgi:hypothetical protein